MPRLGSSIAVDGWLSLLPELCQPTDGSDCAVRLASGPDNPEIVVPVQDEAWAESGAVPGPDVVLPRHGVYLAQGVDGESQREWAIIARLDPIVPLSMALPRSRHGPGSAVASGSTLRSWAIHPTPRWPG